MKYKEAYKLYKAASYPVAIGAGAAIGGAGMAAVNALLSEKGRRLRGALKGFAYGAPIGGVTGAVFENADRLHNLNQRESNDRLYIDGAYDEILNLEDKLNSKFRPDNLIQSILDASKAVKLEDGKVVYK